MPDARPRGTTLGDAITVTALTVIVLLALLVGRRQLMAIWGAVTVAGSALVNTLLSASRPPGRPAQSS